MIYTVVSVRDRAANAFGRPVFVAAAGLAVRSFMDECNRNAADNEMFKHPGDFELFELGVFNDETGRFVLFDDPKQLAIGQKMTTGGNAHV